MNTIQIITRAKEIGRNLISVFEGYKNGTESEANVREAIRKATEQVPGYRYEGEVLEITEDERKDFMEYVEDMIKDGIESKHIGFGSQSILYTIFCDLASDIIEDWQKKPMRTGRVCCPISGDWSAEAAAANERQFGKNWRDLFNGL